MTIEIYCQHCGHHLKIADQYAGQTGACKNCGKQIVVPAAASPPVSAFKPVVQPQSTAIPYKWIGASVAVTTILALGIYILVSRDVPAPVTSSRDASAPEETISRSPEAAKPVVTTPKVEAPPPIRIVNFPRDRAVGRYLMRDKGDLNPYGRNLGPARGAVVVPEGKEIGLQVNEFFSNDLAFLLTFGPSELDFLILNNPSITNEDIRNIEHLTGLDYLAIGFTEVTDQGLRSLQHLVNLTYLGLYNSKITDDGLATLTHLSRLTRLSMGETRITHQGIRSLSSLPLEHIHLTGISLTRPLVDALKAIPSLTILQIESGRPSWADIPGVDRPTSPDSILLLREITQLRTIALVGKLHDDSLIPALSQLTHLKKIEFWSTSVTPSGRDKLRRALPNCEILP